MSEWQPIGTQPVDEWVLLATTGGWVMQAVYGEEEENPRWRWGGGPYVHPDTVPLAWMPLPSHPAHQTNVPI